LDWSLPLFESFLSATFLSNCPQLLASSSQVGSIQILLTKGTQKGFKSDSKVTKNGVVVCVCVCMYVCHIREGAPGTVLI